MFIKKTSIQGFKKRQTSQGFKKRQTSQGFKKRQTSSARSASRHVQFSVSDQDTSGSDKHEGSPDPRRPATPMNRNLSSPSFESTEWDAQADYATSSDGKLLFQSRLNAGKAASETGTEDNSDVVKTPQQNPQEETPSLLLRWSAVFWAIISRIVRIWCGIKELVIPLYYGPQAEHPATHQPPPFLPGRAKGGVVAPDPFLKSADPPAPKRRI